MKRYDLWFADDGDYVTECELTEHGWTVVSKWLIPGTHIED